MKKILSLVFIIAGLLSCKKENVEVSPGLFGKWEIRRTYGGFAGSNTVYKPGNGTTYQFNSDSTFKQYYDGQFSTQGTFHIRSFFPPSGYNYEEIRFNNDTIGERFAFSGTKLTIGEDFDDGFASDYEKVQN
jgi:hypothetical protein